MHVTRPVSLSLHTFVWQKSQQTLEIKQKHGIHTSSFSWLCSFSPEHHPVLINSSVGETCLAESGLEITSYNLLLWFSRVVSSSTQLVDWSQCNFRMGRNTFCQRLAKWMSKISEYKQLLYEVKGASSASTSGTLRE